MHSKKLTKKPTLPKPAFKRLTVKTPVSLIEDKELRKKIRNRKSALAARERKKARMLMLERKVVELQLKREKLLEENRRLRAIYSRIMQQKKPPPMANDDVNQIYGSQNGNFRDGGVYALTNHVASSSNDPPNNLSNNVEQIPFTYDGFQDGGQTYNYNEGQTYNYNAGGRNSFDDKAQSPNNCGACLPCITNSLRPTGVDWSSSLDWIAENIPPLLIDKPATGNTENHSIVLENGPPFYAEYSGSTNTIYWGNGDVIHHSEYRQFQYPNADGDVAQAFQCSYDAGFSHPRSQHVLSDYDSVMTPVYHKGVEGVNDQGGDALKEYCPATYNGCLTTAKHQ